jgi:hypothetical protein
VTPPYLSREADRYRGKLSKSFPLLRSSEISLHSPLCLGCASHIKCKATCGLLPHLKVFPDDCVSARGIKGRPQTPFGLDRIWISSSVRSMISSILNRVIPETIINRQGEGESIALETLDELLNRAEQSHGHMCAGHVLGVRMAMLGSHHRRRRPSRRRSQEPDRVCRDTPLRC